MCKSTVDNDPLAKTLKSFQVDITQNPSLAQLLDQLRGARVTIQRQAETLSGTVLGVETRTRGAEKGDTFDVPVLNLLTGATIRAIESGCEWITTDRDSARFPGLRWRHPLGR